MRFRDRIQELRRVRADQLQPNRHNWRVHPPAQRTALEGVLTEVGYADALLVREAEDGSLVIVDGHLRAELDPDQLVPVLVLDVTQQEADLILATHDPLAALAETDQSRLDELLAEIRVDDKDLQTMLDNLARPADLPEPDIPESYQVVIECGDEAQQQELYERMRKEGYRCRVLTL